MARPTNINENIIKTFESVVNDDINAIILTDEELTIEVNERLKEEDRFSYSAFKDWKAFAVGTKTEEDTSPENYELYKQIRSVIKKALLKQKKHLFDKFRDEEGQWQKWAWIIERKFDDWNIKYKYDHTSKDEQIKSLTFEVINGSEDKNNTSIPEATESTDEDSS